MNPKIFFPTQNLAPFIDYYAFFELGDNDNEAIAFQDYPRTAMDMLFFFKGNIAIGLPDGSNYLLEKCSFVSIFDTNYLVSISADVSAILVRFKANGIYPLTKAPMKELVNNHLDLNDLLDKSSFEVREKMAMEASLSQRIKILENWLFKRYQEDRRHFRLDHGIGLIDRSKGLISVKALSEKLNSNYKSLDRWFLKNVGLSPKRYIQLVRFKSILSDLEQQEKVDWMQLVENYGFHDQAHFIKSFKQYAGVVPTIYHGNQAAFSPS